MADIVDRLNLDPPNAATSQEAALEIMRLRASQFALRDALMWALSNFGPPVRRLVGQNEEYYDRYFAAKALAERPQQGNSETP